MCIGQLKGSLKYDQPEYEHNLIKRFFGMAKKKVSTSLCICGGGLINECCKPFLDRTRLPETAEQLMRSRYSAFVLGDESYLLETWDISTRPLSLDLSSDQTTWLGLEVKDHLQLKEESAEVEFVARFRNADGQGRAQRLHERSRFRRVEGRWYYIDGVFK